jgi:hypothetical protein
MTTLMVRHGAPLYFLKSKSKDRNHSPDDDGSTVVSALFELVVVAFYASCPQIATLPDGVSAEFA